MSWFCKHDRIGGNCVRCDEEVLALLTKPVIELRDIKPLNRDQLNDLTTLRTLNYQRPRAKGEGETGR